MQIHEFPKDKWTASMHTHLAGKAQKVIAELAVEDCQIMLTAYAMVSDFIEKLFVHSKRERWKPTMIFRFG